MNKVYRLRIRFYFLVIWILFFGCAMQHAPGGGPIDREPPQVVFTFPARDSLHISTALPKIEIHFSENVDRASVANNIFISPPVKYEIDWKGWKKIFLRLKDSLYRQQTYVISLGSEIKDMHKNKMKESFTFAFSTGDKIDQGEISGTVYGLKREQRVHLFAYLLSDTARFDPTRRRARYVSRSGKRGTYRLQFLKTGRYRVVAVEDQNHNYLLDANYERLGLPYKDVTLDSTHLTETQVDFKMTVMDSVPPRLTGARAVNHRSLKLRFSEPVRLDSLRCQLADSATGASIPLLGFSPDPETDNLIFAYFPVRQKETTLRIICSNLIDTTGNQNDTSATVYFRASIKRDTTRFRLLEFTPRDSAKSLPSDQTIFLKFSLPVRWDSLRQGFSLLSRGNRKMNGHWQRKDLFSGEFHPNDMLRPDSAYLAKLDFKHVFDLWGHALGDSLVTRYFTIVSLRQLGEISGTVSGKRIAGHPVFLRIRPLKRGGRARSLTLTRPYRFYFPYLAEGKYRLDAFIDVNQNGKYDYGRLFPFAYSEPFYFSSDTIKVRKRWETGGIQFKFP